MTIRKLLSLALVAVMALASFGAAFADEGSEPDWTEYDALIAEIKTTTDFAHREALMHRAEDILMGTGAICPIMYYNDIFMAKPAVQGYYSNPFGTKFFQHATNGDNPTLKLNISSEPAFLDPALNSSVDGAILAANSFGGLYTYNAEGTLSPNFASGYEISEDGLTYTFTMREGLVWSDGSPLTAKDFEYSWKRAANPETAADYSLMYNGIDGYYTYAFNTEGLGAYALVNGKYVAVDADPADEQTHGGYDLKPNLNVKASEDGKTFTVVLSAPCAYFLDLAAFPTFFAVKQEAVEAAAGYRDEAGAVVNPGAWALEAGFVSSGAFTLESWAHDQSMVYVKNPLYWDAANVKLERLEFMLSADDTVIYAAFQAGDLDFIDTVPTDQIKGLIGTEEFFVINSLGTYYAIFNVKSPLFDGKTVEQAANLRKGLGLLIDRQYIIDAIDQTGKQIATSFIPAGMLDGNGGIFKVNDADYTYPVGDGYFPEEPDVDAARELLKLAGYEFGADGMLSASTPLALDYIHNPSSLHLGVAESMMQDFAQIGITMTISTQEWNVFLAERKAGNYDFARNGWIADFNDPINMLEMWTTASGNNDAQFGR